MNPIKNLLNVENIFINFDEFKLNNISFVLKKGHIMGLIGPNGAGKTTTIKLILNILKKQNGKIQILNKDIFENELEIKENIGVVFDSNYFIEDWTIKEVEIAVKMFYKNWDTYKFKLFLKKFNIYEGKKVRELSKGMKMKLMIACALSHDPKLLILDEPTSGLDAISRNELLNILTDYIKDGEHSVLFSTHIMDDLDKIADDITYINNGEIIYTGNKKNLLNSFRIVRGKINELNSDLEKKLIGVRKSFKEFEGLIRVENINKFPNLIYELASMDDIIIFTNIGGKNNV